MREKAFNKKVGSAGQEEKAIHDMPLPRQGKLRKGKAEQCRASRGKGLVFPKELSNDEGAAAGSLGLKLPI